MNQAILVISFGTTHLDALRESIEATEAALAAAFPERTCYRAFTSPTVRRRLKERCGMDVDSVPQALERMRTDGVEDAVIQPTLLIPGEEYDRLAEELRQNGAGMNLRLGLPLLRNREDCAALLDILANAYPVEGSTALVAMGHGTAHRANELYEALADLARGRATPVMTVCTVEGTPTFDDAAAELTARGIEKAVAVPMMLVAGDHAKNDMAGEEPDSLRIRLEAAGIAADCRLEGLGKLPAIRDLYIRRARLAQKL